MHKISIHKQILFDSICHNLGLGYILNARHGEKLASATQLKTASRELIF